MPRDDDEMLADTPASFGSGVIGVCDVCGHRQAVVVLQKERFKLCVLDFLNKTWTKPGLTPGAPLPPYRSERVWFPTEATKEGKAPAIALSPTKVVRHPAVLFTPDVYGITTSLLDGAIRLAREGFEVLLPDVGKTAAVGPSDHLSLRMGARFGGGVRLDSPRVTHLRHLYRDALKHLRGRDLVDPDRTAVIGLSYGASLAAAVAMEETGLSAIVLAYPVPVRPAEDLKLLSAPVLFVHAGADAASSKARAQVEPLAGPNGLDVRFAEFPSDRRDFLARDLANYDVASAEAAWAQVIAFVKQRLMPPPPKPPAPPKIVAAPPPVPPTAPAAPPSTAAAPSAPAPVGRPG